MRLIAAYQAELARLGAMRQRRSWSGSYWLSCCKTWSRDALT